MRHLALALLLLAGCNLEPDPSELFHEVGLHVEADGADADAHFISLAEAAESSLALALPALENTELAEAILAAHDRGVTVELVTDSEQEDDAGIAMLRDGGVPVRLANPGLEYFDFNILRDVSWTSDQTLMTHAFAVQDRRRAVAASSAGRVDPGTRVVFTLRGEDLVEDLLREHNQVFGGTDATAVTAFSSQAKSIAHLHWTFPTTSRHRLQLWFGPQQRLTKRFIDRIYDAKSSIWLLTDDLANEGLTRALQEKARNGFDVRVVVGPRFGTAQPLLSSLFRSQTSDVVKGRVCAPGAIPTLLLIDYEPARDGRQYTASAKVLSHDVYSAARLYRANEVINDQLIDGTLWVLEESATPSGPLLDLQGVWDEHFEGASSTLDCP